MTNSIQQFEQTIRKLDNNKTFFDVKAFPWVGEVEACWPLIRQELDQLLKCIDLLPSMEEIQYRAQEITNDKRWKIFPLCAYGNKMEVNEKRFPHTTNALRKIPHLRAAMFSIIRAKKSIPPHVGPYAGVLRYHLGVKVPANNQCGITIGEDTAYWEEGKSLIFDDSQLHHAWNNSDEDRVVLFVDFTRPLPTGYAEINENILTGYAGSEFMTDALEQWMNWEAAHGAFINQHLSANLTPAC